MLKKLFRRRADVSGYGVRWFLTGLMALILVLEWDPPSVGPVPGGAIELALIAITWIVLSLIWTVWKPDEAANDRVSRGVLGAVAGALFVGAVLFALADTHEQCTQGAQTRDGIECLGEYITVPGADIGIVMALVFCGLIAFGLSIRHPDEKL